MTNAQTEHQNRINRIRYRGMHRGCKETDLLLGQYCETRADALNDAQLSVLEAFLEEYDSDIWNWIVGKTDCPPEYAALLKHIRETTAK